MKRAVLIGSNYTSTPQSQLYGCIDDIVNVSNMLIDAYGYSPANITMLRDDVTSALPTRANILAALKSAMSASAGYTELWIHYSGHGTQVRDTTGDETDGADEAIVPCDYPTAGFITDDELYAILSTSRCRTLVFFDSCHSGSACDLPYSINYNNGAFVKSVSSKNTGMTNPNVIMMSGCRDPQTSADAYNSASADYEGAFTMCLLQALRQNNHSGDIMAIYAAVCYNLIKAKFSQIPVLASSAVCPSYQFVRAGPVVTVTVAAPSPAPVKVPAKKKSREMVSMRERLLGDMRMLVKSVPEYRKSMRV